MKKIYAMLAAMAAIMFLGVDAQAQEINPDYYLGQKGWVTIEEEDPWAWGSKYTYDEQGRVIKIESYDAGVFLSSTVIEYGQNTRTVYHYSADNQLTQSTLIEYDNDGMLKRQVTKTSNNVTTYDTQIELNGNIYTEVTSWYDEITGALKRTRTEYFEYEYRDIDRSSMIRYENVGTDSDPVLVKKTKTEIIYELGEYAGEYYYNYSEPTEDWELLYSYQYSATRNRDGLIEEIIQTDNYGYSYIYKTVNYDYDGDDIIATITDVEGNVYKARFYKLSDISSVNDIIIQQTDGRMYNIQGQRVGADHRGITIMNGKKMLLRR